jgi:peptidase inhibitor family I36
MPLGKALLLALLASLALSSAAMAQTWGRERFPRDGVCFFKDANFSGEYFCVRTGDELSRMPDGMNDKISSVRIFGRAEVFVFQDIRFEGRSAHFDSDIRNLRDDGWNDLISSLRVRAPDRWNGFGRGGGVGRGDGRRGDEADRIVRRAYQDLLGRDPDDRGLRTYRSHIIDDGWSEAQVRDSIRNSPEFRERNTMTAAKAEDIVRRAYLAVLKREPDSGARGYVDKVIRQHWTQEDVERELRKSPEYRHRS